MPRVSIEGMRKIEMALHELHQLRNEVKFLKERNKDLRQKTWYSVYEENLNLRKQLKECYESLDGMYQDFDVILNDNKRLKDVIGSVQEFTKQFT
jgi:hypothetical protein